MINIIKNPLPEKLYKEIESPLSAFNNIQLDIANTLNEIIYGEKTKVNQLTLKSHIIFESDSIAIMGFMRFIQHKDELFIKILKPINKYELDILTLINKNLPEVNKCFFRYIQMYNKIASGYDDVPQQLINIITKSIINNNFDDTQYLIPYKNKIGKNLFKKENSFMESIFHRYEYIIKFSNDSKLYFNYKIFKVLSSELNENKSLENVRYWENDMLKTGTVTKIDAEKFIINLFCYGTI